MQAQHPRVKRFEQCFVVADGNHGDFALAQRGLQVAPDLHLRDGVVHGGEFVSNQHAYARDEGAHNGNALVFAARELMRVAFEPLGADAKAGYCFVIGLPAFAQ